MIEYRKVKNPNKVGNRGPKTQKQIEANKKSGLKVMLINNPMKNPETVEKVRKRLKGRITSPRTLFKKGNKFGRLRKNTKISEEHKLKQSIKMTGRKGNEKSRQHLIKMVLTKNPMKNPEISKKFCGKNNNSKKPEARRKISESNKKNPRGFVNNKKWLITNPNSFKKGNVPWNKNLTGDKYKQHYENGFKNQYNEEKNL